MLFRSLIEGKFPKYNQFIPEKTEKTIEVEKELMLSALRRAALFSNTVRLGIEKDKIIMESGSREVGEGREEIEAVYDGEQMIIAFNSRFLEDGITTVDGENIVLEISEPLKPGIIKGGGGEDLIYIIMPIRI